MPWQWEKSARMTQMAQIGNRPYRIHRAEGSICAHLRHLRMVFFWSAA